jgi:hypothetical protein
MKPPTGDTTTSCLRYVHSSRDRATVAVVTYHLFSFYPFRAKTSPVMTSMVLQMALSTRGSLSFGADTWRHAQQCANEPSLPATASYDAASSTSGTIPVFL